MIKLKIDNTTVEVPEGSTVLGAAAALGIAIPTMCYMEGHSCHPSCMVCMVKDEDSGSFFPSCAMPVREGMNVTATSEEVHSLRRDALELLLSDHVGDCEAPCTLSCPAGMDIPLMNRLIAKGEFEKALAVVREEIALPLILGYICPAPCEKACRRKPIDGAVSICLLKRFAAQEAGRRNKNLMGNTVKTGRRIAVIGSGPAGLAAAFYSLRSGHEVVIFDANAEAGGAMRYTIPAEELPREMLDAEIDTIRQMGAVFQLNTNISAEVFTQSILKEFDAVILATGNTESYPVSGFGLTPGSGGKIADKKSMMTSIAGVFACGNINGEQRMAVRAAAQGRIAAEQAGFFLGTGTLRKKFHFNSAFGKLSEAEENEYLKESVPGKRIEPPGGFIAGFTEDLALQEAQRCLHCDCRKPASCKLRIYADQYGANRRSQLGPDRKTLQRIIQHDILVYEPEKCIRCGLCVEISAKEEKLGLTYIGRGFDVRIGVPFSETVATALKINAEACILACPTGAMALKDSEERQAKP